MPDSSNPTATPAPLTVAEMAEARRLCGAAHRGPWTVALGGWVIDSGAACVNVLAPENTAFLVAARSLLPRLLADRERLEREASTLLGELRKLSGTQSQPLDCVVLIDVKIQRLEAEVADLRAEVKADDQIIATRNRLLDMFECHAHGKGCVPHAMEEVERLRRENEQLRAAQDIDLCRLQFPDGRVPSNTEECARGWHKWFQEVAKDNRDMEREVVSLRAALAAEVEVSAKAAAHTPLTGEADGITEYGIGYRDGNARGHHDAAAAVRAAKRAGDTNERAH